MFFLVLKFLLAIVILLSCMVIQASDFKYYDDDGFYDLFPIYVFLLIAGLALLYHCYYTYRYHFSPGCEEYLNENNDGIYWISTNNHMGFYKLVIDLNSNKLVTITRNKWDKFYEEKTYSLPLGFCEYGNSAHSYIKVRDDNNLIDNIYFELGDTEFSYLRFYARGNINSSQCCRDTLALYDRWQDIFDKYVLGLDLEAIEEKITNFYGPLIDEYSDLGGNVDKVCGSVSKEEGKISLDRLKKFESLYNNYIYEYQELKKYHEHLFKEYNAILRYQDIKQEYNEIREKYKVAYFLRDGQDFSSLRNIEELGKEYWGLVVAIQRIRYTLFGNFHLGNKYVERRGLQTWIELNSSELTKEMRATLPDLYLYDEEYAKPGFLTKIIKLLESQRADNFKEAVNMYIAEEQGIAFVKRMEEAEKRAADAESRASSAESRASTAESIASQARWDADRAALDARIAQSRASQAEFLANQVRYR